MSIDMVNVNFESKENLLPSFDDKIKDLKMKVSVIACQIQEIRLERSQEAAQEACTMFMRDGLLLMTAGLTVINSRLLEGLDPSNSVASTVMASGAGMALGGVIGKLVDLYLRAENRQTVK